MFFPGIIELFVTQHTKSLGQSPACPVRHDDIVDEATGTCDEWIGKLLAVLLRARFYFGFVIGLRGK